MDSTIQATTRNRPLIGSALGLFVGVLGVAFYVVTQLTDQHHLLFIPRFEALGLAVCLLPASVWAGRFISAHVGSSNKSFILASVKAAQIVAFLTVAGLTLGSYFATRILGVSINVGFLAETESFFLELVTVSLVFTFTAVALSFPFQWASKRNSSSTAA